MPKKKTPTFVWIKGPDGTPMQLPVNRTARKTWAASRGRHGIAVPSPVMHPVRGFQTERKAMIRANRARKAAEAKAALEAAGAWV